MRDKFRTVSLKNAVWSGGVSVCSVGGEREQIAVNKKPYKAVRYMRYALHSSTRLSPGTARSSYDISYFDAMI